MKIAMHNALQLEGGPTPRRSFWALITRSLMQQPTNSTILMGIFRQSVINYSCFGQHYTFAEAAISELTVEILTLPS